MKDTFLTISTVSEGLYKEKGSKFLAFAIPVSGLKEIKETLTEKRKEFHDARHVCFAYILGNEGNEVRANDDGEPSGTAGRPILGILQSNNLTNVLLIVVRYFGGTKLGTSGLINAYKEATADAIVNNIIVEKTVDETVTVRFEYPFLNDVMRVVKEEEPAVLKQHFDTDCFLTLRIRRRDFPVLLSRLEKIESLSVVVSLVQV
jgi:uncharacterized YigZ family protein